MNNDGDTNVIGALSLAIADGLLDAARREVPQSVQAAAIALIGHLPGLGVKHLGAALELSHPGAVRLVDRLAREALVERNRSAEDGRAVTLTLTADGRRAYRRVLASRRSSISEALAVLDAEERDTFARLAGKVLGRLVDDEPSALRVCRLCDIEACADCPVENEIRRREAADG